MLVAAALQVAAAWYGALALALGWVWGGGGGGIWLLVSDVRVLMMEWGCCGGALHLGLVLLRFFWGSFFFFLGGGNSVCVSNSPALVCGRGAVDPAGIRCEMGLIQWVVFV